MQVRFGVGRFLKIDGEVIDDFESLPTGAITELPALAGSNGVEFGPGHFLPRT